MIHLEIEQKQIEQIAKSFRAEQKNINIAITRTVRKLSRWAVTHLAREVSKNTKLPNAIIKKRTKIYLNSDKMSSKIWFGLSPISAMHLNPKPLNS